MLTRERNGNVNRLYSLPPRGNLLRVHETNFRYFFGHPRNTGFGSGVDSSTSRKANRYRTPRHTQHERAAIQ